MADEISSPLLSLVRELGLIDDLQYEEVAAELKRGGAPAFQLLQDFGIMQLDDILQVMANYLGTRVVSLRSVQFTPELLATIPANVARGRNHLCGQEGGAGGRGRPRRHRKGD